MFVKQERVLHHKAVEQLNSAWRVENTWQGARTQNTEVEEFYDLGEQVPPVSNEALLECGHFDSCSQVVCKDPFLKTLFFKKKKGI